jgi:hypothetical protein
MKANHIGKSLEQYLSKLYPSKHATTKAKLLLAEFVSNNFLNGEGKVAINDLVCSHIYHLFRPWKIVKVGDVSAVGAFKTSTIKALHSVIDENNSGIFPSPSAVDRAYKLLDTHAATIIGYECKVTKYGEVYYLNFEATLRLLLKACESDETAESSSVKYLCRLMVLICCEIGHMYQQVLR